jgi:purine-binding chemotaxis protein CheW
MDQAPTDQQVETEQMVLFKVAHESFASKISSVREVIKFADITPVPNADAQVAGIINLRGRIVPVMSLSAILDLKDDDKIEGNFILLADDDNGSQIGVIVDEVLAIRRFAEDEVKPAPTLVKTKVASDFIDSVILPGDNEDEEDVILLLNLSTVLAKSAKKLEKLNAKQVEKEAK